ncbi:Serine/arginine-rich splicing factor RSZ21A [Thalictrum thalictroides]|uniref:Serine/arginine-rich splicing factor RSZ21A n=1 Tax=Thalictrum thalictroides TaxID=46969 RepID=A0A7J6WIN9_THATH|nr:Serine/arginine-rich splicing factor RSZ21A [Thalictrum thalictroides]
MLVLRRGCLFCVLAQFLHSFSPLLAANQIFREMSRVYVGNLDPRVTDRELEDEFRTFGVLRSVWVARRPPGYAFIDFDDRRDAMDAIRELDGKNGWRVELSHNSRDGRGGGRDGGSRRDVGGRGGGRGRSGGSDLKCYECGEPGHFARECRLRVGSGRNRSRSPRYRRSPSYGRRSYSPRGRSPRARSISPPHGRSYSRSPPYHRGRDESPYANGNAVRDRRRSRS